METFFVIAAIIGLGVFAAVSFAIANSTPYAGYHKFYDSHTETEYGSFEVFHIDQSMVDDVISTWDKVGWFWWACHPGGLPDSTSNGPFNSATEAYDNARDE